MKLQDKVVVVTGASAGIGRETAVLLAKAGSHVVLTARRAERLEELAQGLAGYLGRQLVMAGNIGEETFAQALIERTMAKFGRVDVLINNAGVGHRSLLTEIPTPDIQTIFDTNVMGLLYATRAALPHMKKQGSGQIVNVSSIVGQRPLPFSAVYCASKTAVNFLSRSLRMECRSFGITVTLVYPGLTVTEFAEARLGVKGANRYWPGVSPNRVGRAIVKAIENGRTEVYITPYDWLFTHLNRLFPRTTDWIIGRFVKTQ